MELAACIKGCLVGGAIGDCLGAPHEGSAGPVELEPPGTWRTTDDTQLTLVTAEAVVERGRVDPAAIAARLAEAYRQGRLTGLGASTRKALAELAAGAHWALCGRRGEMAAGNGAAARVAPLAFHLDLSSQLHRRLLRDVCRITHHSDEAYAGALAVALAIQLAGGTEGGDKPAELMAAVAAKLPDSRTRDRLGELAALPAGTTVAEVAERFGCSGYAAESVPLSLFAGQQLLTTAGGFERVIGAVVAVGGDTDTNAAMAGQIGGAHLGLDGLPQQLVQRVPDLQQLVALAARQAAARADASC